MRKRSKQCRAIERVSGASEKVNGRASGPVLTSGFLIIPAHSGVGARALFKCVYIRGQSKKKCFLI